MSLVAPGSSVKTLTIAVYEDGRRKIMSGAAGNCVLVMESGKPSHAEFTFTGKLGSGFVSDASLLSPTLPTYLPFRFANTSLSVIGWSPCVQTARIDFGNTVVMRDCNSASDASGYAHAMITDRLSTLTIDPEAALVATDDPYGDWLDMDEGALAIGFDDGVDTLDISGTVQPTNIQPGERNGIITDSMTLQFNDDSLTLEWGAA